MHKCYEAGPQEAGQRLDRYLAEQEPEISRSYLQKLIREGCVLADGKPVKAGMKLSPGTQITLSLPEAKEPEILPEELPLDILYEDSDVILINKPKGMVVHPSAGHYTGTLVNALLFHCQGELSGINGVLRPGIVHRIDKDTTGVLIACKNDRAHNALAEQLKDHTITRRYRAVVCGNLKEDEGTVDAPIGPSSHRAQKDGDSPDRWEAGGDPLPGAGALRVLYLYRMPAGDRTDASDPRPHGQHRPSASGGRGLRPREESVSSGGADPSRHGTRISPSVHGSVSGI